MPIFYVRKFRITYLVLRRAHVWLASHFLRFLVLIRVKLDLKQSEFAISFVGASSAAAAFGTKNGLGRLHGSIAGWLYIYYHSQLPPKTNYKSINTVYSQAKILDSKDFFISL